MLLITNEDETTYWNDLQAQKRYCCISVHVALPLLLTLLWNAMMKKLWEIVASVKPMSFQGGMEKNVIATAWSSVWSVVQPHCCQFHAETVHVKRRKDPQILCVDRLVDTHLEPWKTIWAQNYLTSTMVYVLKGIIGIAIWSSGSSLYHLTKLWVTLSNTNHRLKICISQRGITYCSDSVSLGAALTANAAQYSIIVAPTVTSSIVKEIAVGKVYYYDNTTYATIRMHSRNWHPALSRRSSYVFHSTALSINMISKLFSMCYRLQRSLLLYWKLIFSRIPANHHLTITHPLYSRGFDFAFIASFVDIFVREGGTLDASIQRSLHPGRLEKTNVVIKTGGDCVTLVSRKANMLWLGAKACCPQSCLKQKQNSLACDKCHLTTKPPKLLTPQMLGDFYNTYERPKEKPIGAWYKLSAGAFCELPLWSNEVVVMDSPPTVRPRKRRHSDVD